MRYEHVNTRFCLPAYLLLLTKLPPQALIKATDPIISIRGGLSVRYSVEEVTIICALLPVDNGQISESLLDTMVQFAYHMRFISAEQGWKLPKSCSRRRGSSYTFMRDRGNGCGADGISELDGLVEDELVGVVGPSPEEEGAVRVDNIPSVVSRVRR